MSVCLCDCSSSSLAPMRKKHTDGKCTSAHARVQENSFGNNDAILIINLNEINANKTTTRNKRRITVQYKTTAAVSCWGDPC